jgi:NTP pyrophosphatase (non-canonical NTP hydrolase)
MVDLTYLQDKMKTLYYEKDSKRGLYATFTWLVEEIGELADALLSQNREAIEEEIADVIAWTLSIANLVGINAESSLCKKYGC